MEAPAGDPGVHLVRDDSREAALEELVARWSVGGGARVGLAVLDDLDRRLSRARLPLRAVRRAWTWEPEDRSDLRWWPQGITTSADAGPSADGVLEGRRVVAVSWYAKHRAGDPKGGQGVRVSLLDVEAGRYRHVLLVVPRSSGGPPTATPLKAHAGGIAWVGDHLHVAATASGVWTAKLSDVVRLPDDDVKAHFGYRYVLPVRLSHPARTAEGAHPLRYSFISVDHSADPPELVVGEYARGSQTRRLAHFTLDAGTGLPALDADGAAVPRISEGVEGMQGVVVVDGQYVVTVSRGPWSPGSIWVGRAGSLRERRWATPMGPEDLSYWPGRDELWSVTEHPRRRWIVVVDRSRRR